MGSAAGRGDVCFSGAPIHIPGSAASCQKMTYSKLSDGGWEIDATCGDRTVGSQMRMRYAGDFQSAFTIDGRDVLSIAGQAPRSMDSHNRFRYLGPCPPGRAADDPQ
jgi:hypothetical protein